MTGVTVPAGLTLNANGTITVNANTPSGTYTVAYEICEVGASPINCKQATATVVVTNTLVANNDTPAAVATAATPVIVQNVTSNDTLNGVAVTAANTDVTPVTAGPLSIDANGVLTLSGKHASGTYSHYLPIV